MSSPDTKIENAPDYIKPFVSPITPKGPSDLLIDGSWCGHGEPLYRAYDIIENHNSAFKLNLPDTESEDLSPIAVKLYSTTSDKTFLVYDTRKHPASLYALPEYAVKDSNFLETHCCEKCRETNFKVSIGLEIPEDSEDNNDISWFGLAIECLNCGDKTIAFEDETA